MFRAVLRGLLVVPSDVRPLGEPWRGDTAARVQESSCVGAPTVARTLWPAAVARLISRRGMISEQTELYGSFDRF